VERLSELHELRQTGLAELADGAQQAGREFLALPVFLQQQITESLFEAVDEFLCAATDAA
jgi:hypothetical protein